MPTVPTVPVAVPTPGPSRTTPFADRALTALREHGPLVLGLDPSGDLLTQWGLGDTADGIPGIPGRPGIPGGPFADAVALEAVPASGVFWNFARSPSAQSAAPLAIIVTVLSPSFCA